LSLVDSSESRSVRALAAMLVRQIVVNGQPLERVFESAPACAAQDLGLLRALVAGALRWHHRLDWQLGRLSAKKPSRLDADLRALLHVGLLQLQQFRIPDHAAVSATVDAAAELGFGRARGLVNAVLRRFLRERVELESAASTNAVARFSHPAWLIDRIEADWPDTWEPLLEANNELPPMWLRVNLARISKADFLGLLAADEIDAVPSELAPAAIRLKEARPVAELPGYADGLVSVQDVGAQRVAGLLDLKRGLRVLDACAAPGGKTAQIAETEPALRRLVALDRDAGRLETARENLARLGLTADFAVADARDMDSWWDGELFDRILVDAPCSATGVIRRHPDIKVLRRPDDITALSAMQADLVDALWPLVAAGGRMVYATCSVLSQENQGLIDSVRARHADMRVSPFGSDEHFRERPGQAEQDGFYYACLHKTRGTGQGNDGSA
jgi:16S rRNA (cytosine967-C5)-methyltransferase